MNEDLTKAKLQKYNIENMYNDAWKVADFFISINGIIIDPAWYMTYDIKYLGHGIIGTISFKDTDRVKEAAKIEIGGMVHVEFVSQPKTKIGSPARSSEDFVITNVKVDGSKVPIVTLTIKDTLDTALNNVYTNFSFNQESATDIFTKIANETSNLFAVKGPKIADDIVQNITITSDVPLRNTFLNVAKREGFKMVVDKEGAVLVHNEHTQEDAVESSAPEFYNYRPNKHKEFIRNQVLEFQLDGFDMKALETPDMIVSDMTDKKGKGTDTVNASINFARASGGGTIDGKSSADRRVSSGTGRTGSNQNQNEIQDAIRKLQKISIITPGLNKGRLYEIIEIELPINAVVKQDTSEETFTGKWMITGYRDKIVAGYYTQELLLNRSGELA